jgi:hypothetical protein
MFQLGVILFPAILGVVVALILTLSWVVRDLVR